jgi:ornithine--oxo-acid transaminase
VFSSSTFGQKIPELLKYNILLHMNTGAETAGMVVWLSRRWACEGGVQTGKTIALSVEGNFHGRIPGVI